MLKYFDESGPETFFRYRKPNSALLLCWCQSRLTSFPLTQLNPDWHQHGQTQPPALLKSFSLQNPIKFVARANISLETPGVAKSCLAGLTRAARGKTSEDITHVQVCQCSRLLENISLFRTAPKLSHGEGLFLCKGRAPMPVLMSKLCQACFHGGSRGKGSAHRVAMDPLLLLLLAQVFAGTRSAIPARREQYDQHHCYATSSGDDCEEEQSCDFQECFSLPLQTNDLVAVWPANWYFPSLSEWFSPTLWQVISHTPSRGGKIYGSCVEKSKQTNHLQLPIAA